MADAEITILITAIDEMSNTMKRIETQLVKSNKNIEKQTDATTKSFDQNMKSLLALGNIANGVNNIFSMYENLQLRLENATERVTGAQDRLRDAQYDLNKTMASGSATAEDMAQAQAQVDSASRTLTISQNNLERVQNKVIDTYIAMGIQVMVVTKATYDLIAANAVFLATPLGIALMAIAAAAALVAVSVNAINNDIQSYKSAVDELKKATADVANETDTWAKALGNVKSEMMGFIVPKTAEEAQAMALVEEQKAKVIEAKLMGNEEEIALEQDKLSQMQLQYQLDFESKRNIAQAWLEYYDLAKKQELGINTTVTNQTTLMFKQSYDAIRDYVKNIYGPAIIAEHQRIADQKVAIEVEAANKVRAAWGNVQAWQGGIVSGLTGGKVTAFNAPSLVGTIGKMITVGDAIIRPNGDVIKTNPNDTLIATQGGVGGVTLIIEGNIYGVDADDIAEALQRQLNKKLSMGN